jgi:hypothetical protein
MCFGETHWFHLQYKTKWLQTGTLMSSDDISRCGVQAKCFRLPIDGGNGVRIVERNSNGCPQRAVHCFLGKSVLSWWTYLAVDVRPTYTHTWSPPFEGHLISQNDTKWNDVTVRNLGTDSEWQERDRLRAYERENVPCREIHVKAESLLICWRACLAVNSKRSVSLRC